MTIWSEEEGDQCRFWFDHLWCIRVFYPVAIIFLQRKDVWRLSNVRKWELLIFWSTAEICQRALCSDMLVSDVAVGPVQSMGLDISSAATCSMVGMLSGVMCQCFLWVFLGGRLILIWPLIFSDQWMSLTHDEEVAGKLFKWHHDSYLSFDQWWGSIFGCDRSKFVLSSSRVCALMRCQYLLVRGCSPVRWSLAAILVSLDHWFSFDQRCLHACFKRLLKVYLMQECKASPCGFLVGLVVFLWRWQFSFWCRMSFDHQMNIFGSFDAQ